MKTLVVFCPANAKNPHKSHKDIVISDKCLRIIYHSENLNFFKLLGFKNYTRKLMSSADVMHSDFSKNFRGNKIYQNGYKLATYHLSSIIKLCGKNPEITVFSLSSADIYTLSDIIMTNKNINFLTAQSKVSEFNDILLSEFGISGGAVTTCNLNDKIAIIMPGGEVLLEDGAKKIINLSKTKILWQSVEPQNILYTIPPSLKGIPLFLRRGDMLETLFSFFEIDFSYTKPFSLKINK